MTQQQRSEPVVPVKDEEILPSEAGAGRPLPECGSLEKVNTGTKLAAAYQTTQRLAVATRCRAGYSHNVRSRLGTNVNIRG